jgi:cell division protein FtsB
MNPEHKELAEKVIDFFKKSEKVKLSPAFDLPHLLPNNNVSNKVIDSLEKNFGLIEKCGKYGFRLTEKGWKFTTFEKLEKDSKKTPLTLFQKLQITITSLSLITAIILGVLNYSLNQDKSALTNQNNLLNKENNLLKPQIVQYKDSLNVYKQTILSEKEQTVNSTLHPKNFGDLKND